MKERENIFIDMLWKEDKEIETIVSDYRGMAAKWASVRT